jgi:acetyl esterase/lipase
MRIRLALITLALSVSTASAQQVILPLWPNGNPEPSRVTGPEYDPTASEHHTVAGKASLRLTNVSHPTLAVYPPKAANTGASALVFPGGGYVRLSMQLEGTEVCDWLTRIGMTCILVKYRVPEEQHYPENTEDLEDAQQAMRLTREHAAEWHRDPARIGAIGFSAGAHLAAVLGTHPDFQGKNVPPSTVDARPAFQMILYPGYTVGADGKVVPSLVPTADTPPTFLVQAENDNSAHVQSSLGYYEALRDAKVPAEMHLYTMGGHGFGMRPLPDAPVAARWPGLAEEWLHTIHILGPPGPVGRP